MPRIVFYTATTLNGFIATEDDSLDWLFEVGSPDAVDFNSVEKFGQFAHLTFTVR